MYPSCNMYKAKDFRVRSMDEIMEDLREAHDGYGAYVQKVFLAADLSRDQLLVVGVGALAPTVVIQAYKVICELTLIF